MNQSFLSRVKLFFWLSIGALDWANFESADALLLIFYGEPSGDLGKMIGDAFGELVS